MLPGLPAKVGKWGQTFVKFDSTELTPPAPLSLALHGRGR